MPQSNAPRGMEENEGFEKPPGYDETLANFLKWKKETPQIADSIIQGASTLAHGKDPREIKQTYPEGWKPPHFKQFVIDAGYPHLVERLDSPPEFTEVVVEKPPEYNQLLALLKVRKASGSLTLDELWPYLALAVDKAPYEVTSRLTLDDNDFADLMRELGYEDELADYRALEIEPEQFEDDLDYSDVLNAIGTPPQESGGEDDIDLF